MKQHLPLRIIVTMFACVGILAHLIWPNLKVDAVTMAFFLAALFPWISPLIKSIELTGVGKVELQEMQRLADDVKGAAASTERLVELASARASASVTVARAQPTCDPQSEFVELQRRYNTVRQEMHSGSARTAQMTKIIQRMIDLSPMLMEYDVRANLGSSDRGIRLSAYAHLFALPSFELLEPLVQSVTKVEDKPFGQYWGLKAISRVLSLGKGQTVPTSVREELKRYALG